MPRRGRRSEAAKVRWRKLESVPDVAKPETPPLTSSAWNPIRSPPKKTSRLLEGGLPDQMSPPVVRQEEPRVPSTSPGSRRGTGHRHRVQTWPASRVTRRSCKLVLPTAEALEKKFALLVGDSHLRAIVDGYSTMPKGDFSLGVLASPGASAEELRLEVLDAVLPRPPEVICLLAPSNNLTASRTFVEAGAAFGALLRTVCNLSANVVVVDFPPRLCVEESVQQLLRQEFQRVAAQRSVRYIPVTEHFPLSSLALWSRDGVHLSDRPGMEVLSQLLQAAVCSQLELSAPKSPAPVMLAPPPPGTASPPAVRRPLPWLVVVGEVAAPRRSDPFDWTVVRRKTSRGVQGGDGCPHATGRVVDQQGDLLDSSIPPNPVWFSPTLLEEMDRIVPASGRDAPLPTCSPTRKKKTSPRRRPISDPSQLNPVEQQMEGAPRETTTPARRQARRPVPPTDVEAPAESSSVPLEDQVRDGSCQASALEPGISGSPVLVVSATHSQADNRNSSGLPQPSGTAVMMTFCNLSDMVNHLLKLFRNRGPNATYEFVPVGFVRDNEDPSEDLAFQNISPGATKGQQRAIHGAVVCVPSDMETVVNSLPRPREEAQLLQVKLKRKTKYKGYQYFYTVNMKNVLAGLRKLKESHPDYKEVSINESATFDCFQEDQPVEDSDTQAEEAEMDAAADQQPDHIGAEHQALRPGLILDTCMQPPDIAQEVLSWRRNFQHCASPGE
ncbi:uncharacterized protein LOC129365627 [Poeciliopsis prolifica]|uniref:uncharacterized protein LOC129365627 n=1 Tax=Poeciliopsis prolifica TaxID=188132 RepID=UPI002413A082|nr:uncharacterized protein LOC129365627 [Poeciliopsis prolifica]